MFLERDFPTFAATVVIATILSHFILSNVRFCSFECAEPLSHTTYNRKPLFQYHLIFSLKRLCANNFQCNQNAVTIQLHSLTWEWQRMCDSCRCGTDVRCDTYMYIFYM